ncbi:MAG TPA: hypothetical protein VMU95_22830 [Trebonia sp.]|nr:hypothetical protein [Trebonia sp.]
MVAAPLVIIMVGASAVGAQAADPSWTIAKSANVTLSGGTIESVSCSGPAACTAVGNDVNTSGIQVTLAESWNGSNWQRQATPNPADDTTSSVAPSLAGVSCPAVSFCVAVGSYQSGFLQSGLVETWNGQQWTAQSSFPVPTDSSGWTLTGVSCTSTRFCEAVGGYFSTDTGLNDTLAAIWNGTTWTAQSTVNPDPNDFQSEQFNTVSCSSPTFCVAWGGGNSGETLAEEWNGSSWQMQTVPSTSATVNSVACTSRNFCAAVGLASAYLWDGSAWTAQTVPDPAGSANLQGVSCTSRNFCEAVGEYNDNPNVIPVAALWNGSAWSAQTEPTPASNTFAHENGVSCVSPNSCEAGGYWEVQVTSDDPKALAEGWNGDAWTLQHAVAPRSATYNFLSDVSCSSASFCEAVGTHFDSADNQDILAETWNGQKWTVQSTPNPANPYGSPDDNSLYKVSCVSPQFCEAVGAGPTGALTLMWNGTSWTLQTRPGASDVDPQELSCASTTFCLAADPYGHTDTWDGTAWTAGPTVTGLTYVGSISCQSATFCEAVGASSTGAEAAAWNGTSWTDQTVAGPFNTVLNSVSCTAATSCEAVGEAPGTNDEEETTAESWDGSAWTVQSITSPSTTQGSQLTGVSCTSATSCSAVGWYTSSAVPTDGQMLTVAETWDGTAWTLESSPNPSGDSLLQGVSCGASQVCTAVGETQDPGGSTQTTLIETGD